MKTQASAAPSARNVGISHRRLCHDKGSEAIPEDPRNGMVWRAISRGLRAVIYRPAQIVRASAGGPPHDLFEHVVRVCHTLRAVPDIDARIDMITSEYAVSAI